MSKTLFKTAAVGALVTAIAVTSLAPVADARPRGNGGAVAAGLAIGLIGGAAIAAAASQPRYYYDEPGYYGRRVYSEPVYAEPVYEERVYVAPRPVRRPSRSDGPESPNDFNARYNQPVPPSVYYGY